MGNERKITVRGGRLPNTDFLLFVPFGDINLHILKLVFLHVYCCA